MKIKFFTILLCIVLCINLAGCGGAPADEPTVSFDSVPLTAEEQEIIEIMGDDINVISDEDYIHMVSELIYHGASLSGQVFQLEGTLAIDGESMVLYRNLVHGSETATLGIPLRYLEKEIQSGAWVKVVGIVSVAEVDGQQMTVLDIAAIEGLAMPGKMDLEWDGGNTHQH